MLIIGLFSLALLSFNVYDGINNKIKKYDEEHECQKEKIAYYVNAKDIGGCTKK